MRRARALWRSLAELRRHSEEHPWCPSEAQRVVDTTNIAALPAHDATFLFKYCIDAGVPQSSEIGPIFQMYFTNHVEQLHAHQFEVFLQGLAHFGQLRDVLENDPTLQKLLPFVSAFPPNQLFGCVRALAHADHASLPLTFYQKATVRILHAWRKGKVRSDINDRVHLLSVVDRAKMGGIHWREVGALGRRLQKESAWAEFALQLPCAYVLRLLNVFHRAALEREDMLHENVLEPLRRLALAACERGSATASEQARVAEAIGFFGGDFPFMRPSLELSVRHRLSLLWAPLVHRRAVDEDWHKAAEALVKEDLSSLMTSSRRKLMLRQVRQECGDKAVGSVAWSKPKRLDNRRIDRWVQRSKMGAMAQQWSFWSKPYTFLASDFAPLTEDMRGITGFERIEARHLQAEHRKVMFVRSDATLRTVWRMRDSYFV